MCMSALPVYLWVHCVPAWCLWRPEEGTRSLGTAVALTIRALGIKPGSSVRAVSFFLLPGWDTVTYRTQCLMGACYSWGSESMTTMERSVPMGRPGTRAAAESSRGETATHRQGQSQLGVGEATPPNSSLQSTKWWPFSSDPQAAGALQCSALSPHVFC